MVTKSEGVVTALFLAAVLVYGAAYVWMNTDESNLRLVARCIDTTLFASSVFLLVHFFCCRLSFFLKFFAVYSVFGFLLQFGAYFAYSKGTVGIPALVMLVATDYLDYFGASLMLLGLIGFPVSLLRRRQGRSE